MKETIKMLTFEEVQGREDAFYAAQTSSDLVALADILSDDIRFVHTTGRIDSKTDYLKAVAIGQYAHGDIWRIESRIVLGNEGAVSTGVIDMVSKPSGIPAFTMRIHHVLTWRQTTAGLQLSARQATRQPL